MDLQKAIEELSKSVGKGAAEIFPYYERWFFINAICVVLSGVIFMCLAVFIFKRRKWFRTISVEVNLSWIGYVLPFLIFLCGFIMFFGWMPDLFCPGGYAYHQIIHDLRK